MANYNDLKTGIDAVIKTNGRQEISGAALNAQLKNMIAELGAGYQYMGVATPATNPGAPDANVFYLASEAGTYTNFGGIIINEGKVCALVWNGTWTKQMTGAATADRLNQLGQQVIYDVTMNNSNHPTFASLLALLSDANLSTLIPTNVRCGGMSIRFVQTSDNKYVQYRLMADEWSTTVGDWQGVDDEPIAGSENMVTSGGIFNSLLDIRQTIGLLTFQLRDFSNNGWVASTNKAEANLEVALLNGYDSFIVTPKTGYEIAAIHFNTLDGIGATTLLVYQSEPIDFKTLNSNRTYYGVMIRKSDQSAISQSELSDLVSISKQTKELNASEIVYDTYNNSSSGVTPNTVQGAIDDIYSKINNYPESILIFKNEDVGPGSLVSATNRALAIVEKEQFLQYAKYEITSKTGYLLCLFRWVNDPTTNYSGPNVYPSAGGWTNTAIDIIQVLNGYNYFGVIVKKSDNSTILPSEFGNMVTVTAEKIFSSNVAFMATDGNDNNDGTYSSPVLTIGRALSISDNVVIKEGQYDNFALNLANISNRNISIKADTGKQVILMNRSIYATTGSTGSLVSGKTNVYQIASSVAPSGWLYQHLVNDVNAIVAKEYSHPAQRGKQYRCDSTILRNAADSYSTLSDALNFIETEAASDRYYFFYDSGNQMLYFSRPQTPSAEHPICGSKGACITGSNDRNKIYLTGLNFYYGTVDFENVEDSEVADCAAKYTYGWGAFHWRDCKNLKYIRCEAAGNCYGTYGDGFNGDSTIMTVDPYTSAVHLIDCWAHDNHDDGYSDHNGCNCNVLGGLYEYNRKGGVTPAAGSHCTVLGTISRNNINGFYYVVNNSDQGIAGNVVFNDCLAYNNEDSGFRCEGTNNYAECVNCISHDNVYGYRGVIKARNCYSGNNTNPKDTNVIVIQVSALS